MRPNPVIATALIVLATLAARAQDMPAVPVEEVVEQALEPAVRRSHAIAMHGEPKYGSDFKHFDYVNPDAPKGGTLVLSASGTFDSFNPFIIKGSSGPVAGIETLLTSSADEPFTKYGLIAESIEWPDDRSWITFTLRPEARWHDGNPITVEDVIWSLETLKTKGRPFYRYYYGDVVKAEQVGERQVKFTFGVSGNRELPLILGELPVLAKHYWQGRDFEKTSLEPPLGSGPYRVANFEAGRFVELERVEDYWAKDLPVNVGQDNFDRIRYEYFRDPTVIREAVKSGNIDFFSENSAKDWAKTYDTRAVRDGLLIKKRFLNTSSGGMQGFIMNTRRSPFDDKLVRQALAFAYDFEWTNRNIYYDQYVQPKSYFDPMELASSGLPEGEELEILERFRGRVPEEVFTEEYLPPTSDGSGWPRENFRRALELLAEAGWGLQDFKLVNTESGQQLSFEFLYAQKSSERTVLPFVGNLRRLGIDVRLRFVDSSQYINRIRSYDFDMIILPMGQSISPGNEQREYWGSEAAKRQGSRNRIGISDPVVDELIELVISASNRESLVQRTRALDRVLLWGHYAIPQLISPYDRIIYWDKFGLPEITPMHGVSSSYWWFDPVKAANLEQARKALRGVARAKDGVSSGGLNWFVMTGLGLVLAAVLYGFHRHRQRTAA
jgi:microcin C transport system substrate-binding protein